MDSNTRDRAGLKSFFVDNAIPTGDSFAELIDAPLNQRDDGIVKLPGAPISIEAVGEAAGPQDVLSLYSSFAEVAPSWTLSLNPRAQADDPATARPGLAIADGAGTHRLFIRKSDGFLGAGTVEPSHALHVKGPSAVGLYESTDDDASLRIATREGMDNAIELGNRAGGRLALRTQGAGDVLNIVRTGNIGIRTETPQRTLHVGGSGQLQLSPQGTVEDDSTAGLYWHGNDDYSIQRGLGAWDAPDYQQLRIRFATGITLEPGDGDNVGSGRSYVDVRNGKGLRVSHGTLGVGPVDPGGAKLRVSHATDDYIDVDPDESSGKLEIRGWTKGYNIATRTDAKHLYLNRDSQPTSNIYIGRKGGHELHVLGNGNVGVGVHPTTKLHVDGATLTTQLTATQGLLFNGTRDDHLDADGSLYRMNKQVYLTVDDHFYIRDNKELSPKMFHFETDSATLSLSTLNADAALNVQGLTTTDGLRIKPQTFKVGGNTNTFYPVIFQDQGWADGPFELDITRAWIHTDIRNSGSVVASFRVHSSNWGHNAHFCRCEIHSSRKRFVAWYTTTPQSKHFVVWLRGGHTYNWRCRHLGQLVDANATTGKKIGGGTYNTMSGVNGALDKQDVWEHHHRP